MLLLRWLLVLAIGAAILSFIRSRQWRTFPAFTAYLAIAGIAAATHVRMEQWAAGSWVNWQWVLVALRVACALEILLRLTAKDRDRRLIRFGVVTVPAGLLLMIADMPSAVGIARAATSAKYAECWIICMLMLLLMLPLSIATEPAQRRHAWLFLVLMLNQVWQLLVWEHYSLDFAEWQAVSAGSWGIAIMCFAAWALQSPAPVPVASAAPQEPIAQS